MKQQVRIIGGKFRGKKLDFPDIEGLRPTPDRVRETVFNWLMHDIRGARCLDLFAGSGALGFEAFSRGAKSVVLIEQADQVFKNLVKISLSFNSPDLSINQADAIHYLHHTRQQFDIIFLDPPFAKDCYDDCLYLLAKRDCLCKGGLLYIESPAGVNPDPLHWQERKSKQAGNVCYSLYEKR